MIAKTMLGSLVVLYLLASVLTTAVADEPPDYDATGTWDYEINNLWSSCSGGEPAGATGTVQIVQTADTFSIQADGGAPDYGSIYGNRYQLFNASEGIGGTITNSITWGLQSSTVGEGLITMIQINPGDDCAITGEIHFKKQGVCHPTDTAMCLQNGRFAVSVSWNDEWGGSGVGHAIPATDDSGLFWFFSPSNMELLIKVLDGCGFNSHYWVFFAATTDQQFDIRVTDTQTGDYVEYTNPLKNPADAVTDTFAFDTCP